MLQLHKQQFDSPILCEVFLSYRIQWTCNEVPCGNEFAFHIEDFDFTDIEELNLECYYELVRYPDKFGRSTNVYIISPITLYIEIETGTETLNPGHDKVVLTSIMDIDEDQYGTPTFEATYL